MIYSKSIDDMRTNEAINVRAAFKMCESIGLPLGVANTLRDQEYQTSLYLAGIAPKTVTFHAHGLAIDIYIKIKGHEYDTSLYPKVAEVFKKVGFSWMWDIAHNEMAHFQWDNHRAVTGRMIIEGNIPPEMPIYKEIKSINEEDDNMVRYQRLGDIPDMFRGTIEILMKAKIINGDGSDPIGNNDVIDLSHDQVRNLIFEYRGGAFDKKLIKEGLKPAVL
jgi:hypothetical protein